MPKLRLSGAFVTKFYEEWKAAGDTMLVGGMRESTYGEKHARVERFLDAIKYDLAKVLTEEMKAVDVPAK